MSYTVCLVVAESYEEVGDDGRKPVVTTRMGKHEQLRQGQGKQLCVAWRS